MTTTLDRGEVLAGVKAALPFVFGMIGPGMICGIAALAAGASPLAAIVMSVLMFSATGQLIATQMLAVGAPVVVILLSCFVVSLRWTMYSATLAPEFRPLPRGWRRLLGFVLSDPMFAAAVERYARGADRGRLPSWLIGNGLAVYLGWQLANAAGVFVGSALPPGMSLDFIIPLSFIGLIVPQLRDPALRAAAVVAGIASVALWALPLRLSLVVAAVAGIAAGLLLQARQGRQGQPGQPGQRR